MTNQQQPHLFDILQQAKPEIISIAEEVGIDGEAVLANLPAPGTFWQGSSVPVIQRRYRGACSVLFHVNNHRSGLAWPYFRFHTFKEGGDLRTFNGLTWLSNNPLSRCTNSSKETVAFYQTPRTNCQQREAQEQQVRLHRFQQALLEFEAGSPLSERSLWLQQRLSDFASSKLGLRADIRFSPHRVLAKLERANGELIGFQAISAKQYGDDKRFLLARSGTLKGSFVRIRPSLPQAEQAVLLCEGVATALSLALVWQGEIRAALCASNIKAVRETIEAPVIFAHDMDIYKPHIGNVGLLAAKSAMQATDRLITPRFHFLDHVERPTDFNDVLQLYGLDELYRQVRNAY